jgi:hypothetical protein
VIEVMRIIEKAIPKLAATSSIDISIEGEDAEEALIQACAYVGERLSARGAVYRMPNDAWYHFDLTGQSFRPQLISNAKAKLRPDGFLVLTSSDHAQSEFEKRDLVHVLDRTIGIGNRELRVRVFQMPATVHDMVKRAT